MDGAGGPDYGGWAFRRVTRVYIGVQHCIVYNTAFLDGVFGRHDNCTIDLSWYCCHEKDGSSVKNIEVVIMHK